MSPNLLFLFIFQSGIALALAYFMTSILAKETRSPVILKVRNGMIAVAILLPIFAFFIYRKSLPEGESIETAFWPSLWIFMVLISIAIGITIGFKKAIPKNTNG